ncbi:hypothetical protein BD310DRAFT_930441 [Dichomitus squalens]|uniref:Glycosyltransferase 61 catalytic domain-containing protein n=1 Tax=Dichomitus squalens TaxID=114155 RepID=A0A4Q9PR67_9APHY|nr:hypothetical protein BD310DRAFT_930441 [Dichomitus squalens]
MVGLTRPRTFRDVALIFLGAAGMHFTTSFLGPFTEQTSSIVVQTQVDSDFPSNVNAVHGNPISPHDHDPFRRPVDNAPVQPDAAPVPAPHQRQEPPEEPIKPVVDVPAVADIAYKIPETTLLSHAPGWTVFRNLYMSNGTVYIVTSRPKSFPDILYMTSTGLKADSTPENIQARLPTSQDMSFLTPEEARDLWGGDLDKMEKNRIWSVSGNTAIINEPSQFLDHYYHFVAEWLFGAWAFWQGTFNAVVKPESAAVSDVPPLHRLIFANADANGWRDRPGFNSYVLRSAFPALDVEVEDDWDDRILATSNPDHPRRAWHFDTVLFTDRSAAFKGALCGSQNQRIASEATEHMRKAGNLTKLWWEPVRRGVLRFAGIDERTLDLGVKADAVVAGRNKLKPLAGIDRQQQQQQQQQQQGSSTKVASGLSDKDIVITYISRQSSRASRHLLEEDHAALVATLEEMVKKHGWELNVVEAEKLSKEQQLAIAARTTIMLGVHGNGLTHLLMMPVTPVSSVIEIFIPGGFAHDYHWTSQALGMRHFAIWNDTARTYPNEPPVDYPEGFQGTQIPVYPPAVVQVIEDRIAGLHPFDGPPDHYDH